MFKLNIIEIIGYIASIIVALSLMTRSIIKLRIFNLIGAIFFSIYGLIIKSFPIASVNIFITIIDIYYIIDFFLKKEKFQFYFANYKNNFARKFIDGFFELYKNDMKKFFPDFDFEIKPYHKILLFFRNLKPAGILILRPINYKEYNLESKKEKSDLSDKTNSIEYEIRLDYVTPEYRDFKIGKFIFITHKDIFSRINAKKIFIKTYNPAHIKYLKKMNFTTTDKVKTVWEKIV